MKPSEMTNERIAEELIATIPHLSDEAWSCTDADDVLREAADRLRKFDIAIVAQKARAAAEGYADGREEVADLRRRLKVAEEICEHEIASRRKTPARCEMCLEDSSAGEDCPYRCKSCGCCNSPTCGEFPSERECEPFVEILASIREEGGAE